MINSIKDAINVYIKMENELIENVYKAVLKYSINIDEAKLKEILTSYDDIRRERDHYKRLYENKHQRNINIAKRCIHYCNNNCNLKQYYCDGKCSRFKERKV